MKGQMADGVMCGEEEPAADYRHIWREFVGDGVDMGYLQGIVDCHPGQDTGICPHQQGLPGTKRTNHQDVDANNQSRFRFVAVDYFENILVSRSGGPAAAQSQAIKSGATLC